MLVLPDVLQCDEDFQMWFRKFVQSPEFWVSYENTDVHLRSCSPRTWWFVFWGGSKFYGRSSALSDGRWNSGKERSSLRGMRWFPQNIRDGIIILDDESLIVIPEDLAVKENYQIPSSKRGAVIRLWNLCRTRRWRMKKYQVRFCFGIHGRIVRNSRGNFKEYGWI